MKNKHVHKIISYLWYSLHRLKALKRQRGLKTRIFQELSKIHEKQHCKPDKTWRAVNSNYRRQRNISEHCWHDAHCVESRRLTSRNCHIPVESRTIPKCLHMSQVSANSTARTCKSSPAVIQRPIRAGSEVHQLMCKSSPRCGLSFKQHRTLSPHLSTTHPPHCRSRPQPATPASRPSFSTTPAPSYSRASAPCRRRSRSRCS